MQYSNALLLKVNFPNTVYIYIYIIYLYNLAKNIIYNILLYI